MNADVSLSVAAELAALEHVRHFIEQSAAALQVEGKAIYDLLFAVNEMVTNIVVHGYQGRPGLIEIRLRRQGDTVEVCLLDHATSFDPTRQPAPDITMPPDQCPPGGLGIHMTRHFIDEMSYRIPPQGGNELTLIKHI